MCAFGQFNIQSYSFLYQDVAYFDWFKQGNHVRNNELERFRAILIWKRLPKYAEEGQLNNIWNNFNDNNLEQYPLVTRVFLEHLHQPTKFPIFDDNVWKAMRTLRPDIAQRTPVNSQDAQYNDYINEYQPFFNELYADNENDIACPQIDGVDAEIVKRRVVDRALFEYGRLT